MKTTSGQSGLAVGNMKLLYCGCVKDLGRAKVLIVDRIDRVDRVDSQKPIADRPLKRWEWLIFLLL